MKLLRFIGLGLATVTVTGGVAFVARLLRNSRRCPECDGALRIESFEVIGEEESELQSRTLGTCSDCGGTFVSCTGGPWTATGESNK